MNEMQRQFVSESRELIHSADEDLTAVARDGFDKERIDRIFRAFHTLKGGAGVMGLPPLVLVLHAAEDLLSAITARKLAINAAIANEALTCLDQVSRWIDYFETAEALPVDADQDARLGASRLRTFLGQGRDDDVRVGKAGETGPAVPNWVSELLPDVTPDEPELWAIAYVPRADCFFIGDDPLGLVRRIPDIRALNVVARDSWPPLGEMDPFACNLRIEIITPTDRSQLADIFRLVPDQVEFVRVERNAGAKPAGLKPADTELVATILAEQRKLVESPRNEDFVGCVGSAANVAGNALTYLGRRDLATALRAAADVAISDRKPESFAAALQGASDVLAADAAGDAGKPAPQQRVSGGSLRVDQAKIDAMFNLAGEMIVAQNGMTYLARRAEEAFGDHDVVRQIKREHQAMQRLVNEMHAATLQLRMIPLTQLFRSLPRQVREVANRLGKTITVETRGESTESDKNIVDRLFEPMMHLVRNAADHGIESAADSRQAGKPEKGVISVEASRAGDRLLITVSDDGRGIDPRVIRAKARERNLMPDDELAALTDEQAIQLVFAAGFSTTAAVSDISGRGVGMDVVRAAVEQMGGRVALASDAGVGTTVRIDLPLNIAVSRVMVVDVGGHTFGIPMDAVTETVRLSPDRISEIKGNKAFVLRDRVIPICNLAELMNIPAPSSSPSDNCLIIVAETAGRVAGLEVEAVRDRLDAVLKPMEGLLANSRGYAGTTLLGDGSVLLVLDLKEIIP